MAIRYCIICGQAFDAPPSSKKITCSAACSRIRKSQSHLGKRNIWSDAARERARQSERHVQQARRQQISATAAAMQLPEGQKGAQHRSSKIWVLRAPDGTLHHAIGLAAWVREHYRLFEPDTTDPAASIRRICGGIQAMSSAYRARIGKPVSSYKGWQLLSVTDKTPAQQAQALTNYATTTEEDNPND